MPWGANSGCWFFHACKFRFLVYYAGKVSFKMLMVYVNAMGGKFRFLVLMSWFLLVELCRVGATVWLSYWTGITDRPGQALPSSSLQLFLSSFSLSLFFFFVLALLLDRHHRQTRSALPSCSLQTSPSPPSSSSSSSFFSFIFFFLVQSSFSLCCVACLAECCPMRLSTCGWGGRLAPKTRNALPCFPRPLLFSPTFHSHLTHDQCLQWQSV